MAIFGTKAVEYAEITADGTLPLEAAWKELCKTYRDTVEIVDADPEVADEFSDQLDEPFESFFIAGKTEGKFSGYEYDTETLVRLIGGTVVDNEWTEGDRKPKKIALRFKTDSGHQIAYPVVSLFAKKNLKLKKKEVALIDCQFTPLSKIRIKKLP
ncbi:hypothetical protein [Elizabethkingia anophelis]|uniref:hypothetical protein n=1 Tax=Elizabethkingia anophelis TaxID=1117645 RepID=UPI0013169B7F|nr:hypothetical protein [Elizabethkingia anophelis]MCT3673573.1 hypothetical protein [Elizabethkingia anophelis]MCT3680854.1 hypothetical protein [Elizabethkingia anophelis]MDV4078136.1 hypothetical protein [Elizabethkingia anophelis]BBQ07935.1 hypothetical protein JUNP353_2506 [Elizabethkingia anophelis]